METASQCPSRRGSARPVGALPDDTEERIEIRDGRAFTVTVLPDARPRKQSARKVGGGKLYARQSQLATDTAPLRRCVRCKHQRPISFFEMGKKVCAVCLKPKKKRA